MKRIYYIARNELYSLYCSPIAWAMMILFFFMTSTGYLNFMSGGLGHFERGGEELFSARNQTDVILANLRGAPGYFLNIISNMYLFLPLITMGLISKETSSGTIKLLYSSPITIRELVMGKFMAMVCFVLTLLFLLLLTVFPLCHSLTHPDYSHIVAAFGGLLLVLCTYCAIGLFISSLTSYQIVAGIITFGLFAFLGRADRIWQNIDVIRNISYYLYLQGKAQDLITGLFNTRDIAYFLILTLVFLSFTVIRLKSAMESISRLRKFIRYAIVVVAAFFLGYITSRPKFNLYRDFTRDQIHSITKPTQQMLAKLNDGPLDITVFVNLLHYTYSDFAPSRHNFVYSFLFEPYVRFKPDIRIKYVYYYDAEPSSFLFLIHPGKTLQEIAEEEAKSWNISLKKFLGPSEIRKLVDVKKEDYRSFFQLKYKGKTSVFRMFDDMIHWPREDEIAAALNRLIAKPPKIDFLCDEIERNPFFEKKRDYSGITSSIGNRFSLANQGYDFDTISLKKQDIPANIAALVIADPRTPIAKESLDKIFRYIHNGGNLWIASESDRKDIIKPILDTLGISLRNGLLIQPSEYYSGDVVYSYITKDGIHTAPQFVEELKNEKLYYGDSIFRVALGGASAMDYKEKNGFHIRPLLTTDSLLAWNRVAPISNDSLQLKVKRLPSDEKGTFVTQVLLKRPVNHKEQRIIVSSDADFMTPSLSRYDHLPRRYNYDFGFYSMSIFSYGQFPANTIRPQTDNSYDIKMADVWKQRVLLYYIIPSILLLIGSVILIRRKRK
ncbi:Gldg family protein [Arachidicoccus terrestris]|uniref:Gldg family protein n=1 Tax=Arachidicoccus terrestris TaxID=2875539 RepID=UPI001CC3E2AB|nr:Gldg family protein [Arachidicoccus terrestris]UAY55737.1 Gldg family protein [Arachidicoccus terrestris]